ncbi:serine carboxypeptidase domain-containing protein [Ditylenchus destructor]|nr:serine carboxypeptidase domain-containing protein [Ditylenchus destructor]
MCTLLSPRIATVLLFLTSITHSFCELNSEEDVIDSLPGLSFDINFGHYSGYLNVSTTRRLHYWFVESQLNPANDPVFFWFNGGPYCSSLCIFKSSIC